MKRMNWKNSFLFSPVFIAIVMMFVFCFYVRTMNVLCMTRLFGMITNSRRRNRKIRSKKATLTSEDCVVIIFDKTREINDIPIRITISYNRVPEVYTYMKYENNEPRICVEFKGEKNINIDEITDRIQKELEELKQRKEDLIADRLFSM